MFSAAFQFKGGEGSHKEGCLECTVTGVAFQWGDSQQSLMVEGRELGTNTLPLNGDLMALHGRKNSISWSNSLAS